MALLADLTPGLHVHDPFAGSGTMLIEAGLRCRNLVLSGWDIDREMVTLARDHAKRAGVRIGFSVKDAFRTRLDVGAPDRVLVNPPWDRSVKTAGASPSNPLDALIPLLGPETHLVAVAHHEMQMPSFLRTKGHKPGLAFRIRISGRLADIVVVTPDRYSLSNDFRRCWDAMHKIPWQGEGSQTTIEIPADWGPLLHAQ